MAKTKKRATTKMKSASRRKSRAGAKPAARARPAAGARMPSAAARVSCSVCMKDVPKAKALRHDTPDHVLYFCGPPCLEQWKSWDRRQDQDDIRRAVDDGMQDLRMRWPG